MDVVNDVRGGMTDSQLACATGGLRQKRSRGQWRIWAVHTLRTRSGMSRHVVTQGRCPRASPCWLLIVEHEVGAGGVEKWHRSCTGDYQLSHFLPCLACQCGQTTPKWQEEMGQLNSRPYRSSYYIIARRNRQQDGDFVSFKLIVRPRLHLTSLPLHKLGTSMGLSACQRYGSGHLRSLASVYIQWKSHIN